MAHHHEMSEQSDCPDCAVDAFARNHYFTGKLMVERDFTDEQRYFQGKLQRHNHNLHGSGVVCGLKVTEHPNPNCQGQYVIIEPGTAIDCCGHEIVLRDELRGALNGAKGVLFNFAQHPKVRSLRDAHDQGTHSLQFCLRYKECPTEQIPVLYDECGCNDTQCAPNRILESYEVDVVLDGPLAPDGPENVKLQWKHTVQYAHVFQAAVHDGSARLFVMTVDASGTAIYAIDTGNGLTVDSVTSTDAGLALAISADGKELYVAVKTATNPEIRVLDATNLKALAKAALTTGSAVGLPTVLAAPVGGSLVALFGASGDLSFWDAPLKTGAPSTVLKLSPGLAGLVLSKTGTRAYLADKASHNVRVIDVVAKTHANADDIPIVDPAPGSPASAPSSLALAHHTAGDILLVGDGDNLKLHVVQLGSVNSPLAVATLSQRPVAFAASPGAHWVYVLERDAAGKSFIEPVSMQRLLLGKPPLVKSIEAGPNSGGISLSESGETLYIAFDDQKGGVALIDVTGQDCADLLWRSLNGCRACEVPDCIILATVQNYHLDDKVEDQTDPPADSKTDASQKIARIDNRKGRHLLPSTQVLTDVVECLLEQGGGGGGKEGPPGPPGLPGLGVASASASTGSPVSAALDPVTRDIHFVIPPGAPAPGGSSPIIAAGIFDANGQQMSFTIKGFQNPFPGFKVPSAGLFDIVFPGLSPGNQDQFIVKGTVIIERENAPPHSVQVIAPTPSQMVGIALKITPPDDFIGFMLEITDLKKI